MKVFTGLTQDNIDLLNSLATVINGEYFNIPFWFKKESEDSMFFEVMTYNDLPQEVKDELSKFNGISNSDS